MVVAPSLQVPVDDRRKAHVMCASNNNAAKVQLITHSTYTDGVSFSGFGNGTYTDSCGHKALGLKVSVERHRR